MVRTSDFQSENVGSIPSNPIKMLYSSFNKIFVFDKINLKTKNKISYSFSFISLIPPFLVNNLRFSFNNFIKEKKILIKQSYILLTWFYYLSFIQQTVDNKNKLKFFVLPTSLKKFTLTKAPMAHKNWSKEQYKFQFYRFKISFNVLLKDENELNSLNSALLFVLLTKKTFPQFETNIFFLKNVNFYFYLKDKNFFNYHKFLLK